MKKLFYLLMIASTFTFIATSCNEDDEPMMQEEQMELKDIVELAQENGYNSLAAALTKAGLIDDLQGDGPFTVFAPTDAAFDALLVAIDANSLDDVPVEDLTEILLYHVISGKVMSSDVTDGMVTTLSGDDVTFSTSNGITVNDIAVINPFDVEASNGVIHTIGSVLLPPADPVVQVQKDIIELAVENGFSSLAEALTATDLVSALQMEGPYTVFAPTNEAFAALLETIGQSSISDIPVDILKDILLYHVVQGKVMSTDVTDGMVETLQGSEVTLSTMGGIMVDNANVTIPYDVEASNGVIHTIDNVIVPESIAQFVNTVLEPAYFSKSFTTLIEAAVKADLVTTLLETPDLTIFAPTNDAFTAAGVVPADVDVETLVSVLTYHVIGAKVMSDGIPAMGMTLNEAYLYFSLTDNGNYINGSTMITAVDIESGSGVVHVIDNVLMPPTGNIVETAVALTESGEFTSLVAALQRTADEGTPEQNLLTVLSGEGPFTVFAPTNAAFQALLDSNGAWTTLADIPLSVLIEVLTYHVVPARAYDVDLAGAVDENMELPTAQGSNLTFDLMELSINGSSNIVGTNTNTTNGVIHVIDAVLVPVL